MVGTASKLVSSGELYRQYAAAVQSERESRYKERLLAGGVGGIVVSLFMTPFDVVKIRLQAQQKPFSPGDQFFLRDGILEHLCTCSNGNHVSYNENCEVNVRRIAWYKRPSHFNGTIDAFRKIAKNEGISSLWSGLYPSILLSLPTVTLYYSSYEYIRDTLGYQKRPDLFVIPLIASSGARTIVSTAFCPMEVLRTKMQSEKMPPSKIFAAVRTQVTTAGFSSLFLGLKPSLIRDVPFSMIYWTLLERYRKILSKRWNKPQSSFLINFIVGSFSGGVAGTVTLPFDVLKTQAQIELGSAKYANTKSISIVERLAAIWLKNGTKGLFAGFIPRLCRVMPACGIMLSTYEVIKRVLLVVN